MVKAIILALLPAILVVLVAIFAISYFGVLSPEAFLPEATTP
tara:strand:+ start:8541 stop:8666 length:126 start_codon:yes stop_codon:yes gene_type:complete